MFCMVEGLKWGKSELNEFKLSFCIVGFGKQAVCILVNMPQTKKTAVC